MKSTRNFLRTNWPCLHNPFDLAAAPSIGVIKLDRDRLPGGELAPDRA